MNPTFQFEGRVLEFQSRPYVNQKGKEVIYKYALVSLDGKVMKFTVGQDCDLTTNVGEDSTLTFEMFTWGDNLSPSLRIVKVR